MCCRVSAERKAQPMPSSAKFPAGWKFIIDPEREGYLDHLASPLEGAYGLKILPPTTAREWYTVEKAVAHNRLALKDVSADAFYEHIGVNTRSQKSAKKPSRSADKTKPTSLPPKASRTSGGGTRGKGPNLPMSLEELFQSRCGGCVNCEKDDCGQCSSCLSNRGSGRQAVCLQKVSSFNEDRSVFSAYFKSSNSRELFSALDVLPRSCRAQGPANDFCRVPCGMEVYSRPGERGILTPLGSAYFERCIRPQDSLSARQGILLGGKGY